MVFFLNGKFLFILIIDIPLNLNNVLSILEIWRQNEHCQSLDKILELKQLYTNEPLNLEFFDKIAWLFAYHGKLAELK